MAERDLLKSFAISLPAVAEMMDEQKLSTEKAMAALWGFLGNERQPDCVLESIGRLESCDDEGELRLMLGQEYLRMIAVAKNR
jgi:hypothetical protein